ncbi:MAG: dihydrofolate reductase [Myxococcales bacterium]|nr:dihydrofolate reductase [Myxococcales bacterium]
MIRSLIVAAAENGVIGFENRLPWRLPGDLARFKRLTMGHHLIMGRKTYESIGRPLPGRITVVLTRTAGFDVPGVVVARSIDEAFAQAAARGDDEPFICGGAEVYTQALATCDRAYLTVVERDYTGDAIFAGLDAAQWERVESEQHPDENPPHRFETWNRRRP